MRTRYQLVDRVRSARSKGCVVSDAAELALRRQVERIGAELTRLGTTHDFEQGDLAWQAEAAGLIKERGVDFESLWEYPSANAAVDCLTHV